MKNNNVYILNDKIKQKSLPILRKFQNGKDVICHRNGIIQKLNL